ncbi:myelin-associated glycoprotein-like isoform X2 [Conger conger]|uniref:myelin-associated glycoprotein-like isoform X2 n=1 Tax=Conger conger TaxID=82655 RepID=UPI002A59F0DF|nr:myelin-associated glycoprotein-like isoform X2 [Conger conger]
MIGAERLILIGCLLQGALGREWAVWMPQSIDALSGSCVLIPCRFEMPEYHSNYGSTYDNLLKRYPDSVTGLWRKDRRTVFDSRSQSESHLKGRITGKLLQKRLSTQTQVNPREGGGDGGDLCEFELLCCSPLSQTPPKSDMDPQAE